MSQDQVSKSQFKAKALEYLRLVESSGESLIVTDHGKPTVEVRPYVPVDRSPLKLLKGTVTTYSFPMEPVAESDWEAIA